MPKVSVVVTTYNRSELLVETIKSVQAQTLPDFEIIVIDDHSTDDTEAVLARLSNEDSRIRYHIQAQNQGAQVAKNKGLDMAASEYINFLDSDDLFHPTKLERQSSILDEQSNLDLVVCQTANFEGTVDSATTVWNTFQGPPPLLRFLRHDVVYGLHAPMYRRERLQYVGKFDEKKPIAQDYEFNARVLILGLKPLLVPDVLCYYRLHGGPSIGKSKQELRYRTLLSLFGEFADLLRSRELLTPTLLHELAVNCLWLSLLSARIGAIGLSRSCFHRFSEFEPDHAKVRRCLAGMPISFALATMKRHRLYTILRNWYEGSVGDFSARDGWYLTHKISDEPGLSG